MPPERPCAEGTLEASIWSENEPLGNFDRPYCQTLRLIGLKSVAIEA